MVERGLLDLFSKFNSFYVRILAWLIRPFAVFLGKGLLNVLLMVWVSLVSVMCGAGSTEIAKIWGETGVLIGAVFMIWNWINMVYVWCALDRINE